MTSRINADTLIKINNDFLCVFILLTFLFCFVFGKSLRSLLYKAVVLLCRIAMYFTSALGAISCFDSTDKRSAAFLAGHFYGLLPMAISVSESHHLVEHFHFDYFF